MSSKSPPPNRPHKKENSMPDRSSKSSPQQEPEKLIIETIQPLDGLQQYKIQDLVEQTEKLGTKLFRSGLKTNQIRKFLDAANALKAELGRDQISTIDAIGKLHLLRPKLAYAAARQGKRDSPVEPMKEVLEAAIKKVRQEPELFKKDFERFAQLVESIIAYHKAAGGRNQ